MRMDGPPDQLRGLADLWTSGNTDDPHHSSGLMLQSVAVEHPAARIVGEKGDLRALAQRHQHGVLPFAESSRAAIAAHHPERMAMQVDRVMPGRGQPHRSRIKRPFQIAWAP